MLTEPPPWSPEEELPFVGAPLDEELLDELELLLELEELLEAAVSATVVTVPEASANLRMAALPVSTT